MDNVTPESSAARPTGNARAGLIDALLFAAIAAEAAGLAYWLVQLFRDKALGQIVWVAPQAVWMAPLAALALFLPLAVPLWIVARIRGGAPLIAGTVGAIATISLLLPFPQLARWASALIAIGVGTQIARAVRARRPNRRTVARAAIALGLVALVGGIGQAAIDAVSRASALRGLPTPSPTAPNVLLIIWDTVRGEETSLLGYDRPTTPTLERLAGSSVVFEQAMSTAPWTLPSHGTMFTGRYGSDLTGSWRRPMRGDVPTLAEALSGAGYRTGGFVANLLYTSRESGLARGFADYRDYRPSRSLILSHSPIAQTGAFRRLLRARSLAGLKRAFGPGALLTGRLPADEVVPARVITDDFLDWQATVDGRPFFAFLNYFDAHGPYRAPDSVRERLGLSSEPLDRYDAAIAHLDEELARLTRALGERGALDRTILVLVSDHGELFGEHDLTGHANGLFLPLIRVPLLVRYPGAVPGGVRVPEAVTLRDLPATILELAGLAPAALPGQSLADRWSASDSAGVGSDAGSPIIAELARGLNVDSTQPNARTSLATILDQRYHYVVDGFGAEQLYDYRADPAERTNLIGTPGAGDVVSRLRRRLDSAVTLP
ncbi:MAG: sulfatase-like hydrolase/transferase [Gemmatimonadales bacterium]